MDRGPSRPTLYSVRIPRVSGFTNRYLDFFIEATSIPEARLDTAIALGQENMGITREQPTALVYGKPFEMTVIENGRFSVYKDLRNWLNLTTQNANQFAGIAGGIVGGTRNQRMQYYDTYTSDMDLIKLEQPGANPNETEPDGYDEVMRVRFLNAYPIGIGSVQLGSGMTDEMTRFTVSFTYESYSLLQGGTINDILV